LPDGRIADGDAARNYSRIWRSVDIDRPLARRYVVTATRPALPALSGSAHHELFEQHRLQVWTPGINANAWEPRTLYFGVAVEAARDRRPEYRMYLKGL